MAQRYTDKMVMAQIETMANHTGLTVEWEQQSGYHNLMVDGSRIFSANTKTLFFDTLYAMNSLNFTLQRTNVLQRKG